MIYKRSNKKSAVSGTSATTIHVISSNQRQLADELHKPIIKKFQKRKVFFFMGNIWAVDLPDT